MHSSYVRIALVLVPLAVGCGNKSTSGGNNNNNGAVCGDGIIQVGELCDGDDLGGVDCASLGLVGGALSCDNVCNFDASACTGLATCGNDQIEFPEDCDGADLGGTGCTDLGFTGGTLGCSVACTHDTSSCEMAAQCGDDVLEPGEECDGADLGGQDCASLGLDGGSLACGVDCSYDVSDCTGQATCGNDQLEFPEVCDGVAVGVEDCTTQGFYTGTLACLGDCSAFDTAACSGGCGDDTINGPEVCDGADLGGQDCTTQGFYTGTLVCTTDCTGLDLVGCSGQCGDGNVDTTEGEECDEGVNNSDTTPDACRTDCTSARCGDGVQDTGEECDDGNLVNGDGCTSICTVLNPPTCTILAPADGARRPFFQFSSDSITEWTFVADATDIEDGQLSGPSVQWISDVIGPLGNGLSITLPLDPPYTHQITCIATDSDAMTGSDTITVEAYSPVAVIWHPGDGETRADCPVGIPWVGRAADYEDGDITSSLVWTSDLDGIIGPVQAGETPGNFAECLNGLGLNTITATATDSDSNDATDFLTLTVIP